MGLNFPTALWKKQPDGSADVIAWETGLWWSHGDGSPLYNNIPVDQVSNFPFTVYSDEYYTSYDSDILSSSSEAYFGWFLNGGIDNTLAFQDLSAYHKEKPWTVISNGLGISIENEADWWSAYDSGLGEGVLYNNDDFLYTHYNNFIQSGEATGRFTLASSSTFQIKASGLGQDTDTETASNFYDSVTMHLLYPNGTVELICSGAAPRDNRFASNSALNEETDLNGSTLAYNMDMQQVKLYAGNDLTSIVNTTDTPKGEPRGNSDKWVSQDNRIYGSYTTSNGIGTFTKNLTAVGDYQVRIKTSTVDGNWNSGAFYGFTFSFS
jgi:hypothetical protein|tara:strand:+ start:2572 stop:3540 length:969 start_codon:yes stop_codon:yes gene_type:complete